MSWADTLVSAARGEPATLARSGARAVGLIPYVECVYAVKAACRMPQGSISVGGRDQRTPSGWHQLVRTIRIRSAVLRAPSFSMTRARCTSMVRGEMPSSRPASLLD